tara:strand:- start:685 stop:1023 length:339 start_codon:yes stop_codon:yes gene_type:complete
MVYVLLILFELIYEVRYGDKHDFLSAVMLSFLMLLAGLFGFAEGHYLGLFYYLGIRFAIFDFSFAVLRGHHWSFLGNTSTWDKVIKPINKYLLLSLRFAVLLIVVLYESFFK